MGALIFLALIFLAGGILSLYRSRRLNKFTGQTEGTVIGVRQKPRVRTTRGSTHWADILFSVGGTEYRYYGPAPKSVLTSKMMMAVEASDAIGKKVPMLYNPDNPNECCIPGRSKFHATGAWVTLSMSAFFFILFIVLQVITRQ